MLPFQILRYQTNKLLNNYTLICSIRSVSTLDPEKPPFLMIASIGNPEPDFKGTRHNVGHWFLDELVSNYWGDFKPFSNHKNLPNGIYSTSPIYPHVFLFKSVYSLMNLQGTPISKTWLKIKEIKQQTNSPALVVVHDELQIPLGKFQIRRQNTSARGHNGLRSINNLMGMGYTKICIGIGKPNHKDISKYVLSKFKNNEKETLIYDVFPKIVAKLEEMKEGKYIYDVYEPLNDTK